jgi:hypothetical protein
MTQNDRLARFLSTGRSITAAQARTRFGIRNLRARISDLRNTGVCVYTNRTSNATSYRVGTPNRAMVSIAYRIAGSRPFGGL